MHSWIVAKQQQTPKTAAELNAMVARRDELRSQISSLTDRRGKLAQERLNAIARADAGGTQDRQLVQEYTRTIDELGARIARFERDALSADDAILEATTKGVGTQATVAPAPIPWTVEGGVGQGVAVAVQPDRTGPPQKNFERILLAEALAFVLLGFAGWRLLVRRAERQALQAAGKVPGLSELRNAVETIAIEVERISENQRYVTKLISERTGHDLAEVEAPSADKKR